MPNSGLYVCVVYSYSGVLCTNQRLATADLNPQRPISQTKKQVEGKYLTTILKVLFCFEMGSHHMACDGLELMTLLAQPPPTPVVILLEGITMPNILFQLTYLSLKIFTVA